MEEKERSRGSSPRDPPERCRSPGVRASKATSEEGSRKLVGDEGEEEERGQLPTRREDKASRLQEPDRGHHVADSKAEESRAAEPSAKGCYAAKGVSSGSEAVVIGGQEEKGVPRVEAKPSQQLDTSKEPIAIVMRAVSFVYRRMVAKTGPEGADMRDFIDAHSPEFDVEGDEHRVEWTVLYKEFESLVDRAMTDFAEQEGMQVEALFELIKEKLEDQDKRIAKFADMLVAAGSYNKFVQMMRSRARAKKHAAAAAAGAHQACT